MEGVEGKSLHKPLDLPRSAEEGPLQIFLLGTKGERGYGQLLLILLL